MSRLDNEICLYLEDEGGLDLLPSMRIIIFSDAAQFDGASTKQIREHFISWSANAPVEEQGPTANEGRNAR